MVNSSTTWSEIPLDLLDRFSHGTSGSETKVPMCIWNLAHQQGVRYVHISSRGLSVRTGLRHQTVIATVQALVDAHIITRKVTTRKHHDAMDYAIWQEGDPEDCATRPVARMKVTNVPCYYCGNISKDMKRDHKTPHSRGGSDDGTNIVPACRSCNSRKGARTAEEYMGDD